MPFTGYFIWHPKGISAHAADAPFSQYSAEELVAGIQVNYTDLKS